ncbi:LysR family transcriptional regulator, partial [Acinetobacter baumannii]
MDRLDCISTFVSVVEHGNFSSAARALDISRDLVAKRVCYLENDLRTTLLTRTTRQMNLTSCGEKFYQHSKVILSEFEWAAYEISYNQQYPEGELKLNTPMSFSNIFLQHIISDFIEKYPSIKIDLFMTDQLLDMNNNKFDLTIRVDGSPPNLANSKILNTYQRYLYAT